MKPAIRRFLFEREKERNNALRPLIYREGSYDRRLTCMEINVPCNLIS